MADINDFALQQAEAAAASSGHSFPLANGADGVPGCRLAWTQGESLSELKENLIDLYKTFTSEGLPGIKRVEVLEIA